MDYTKEIKETLTKINDFIQANNNINYKIRLLEREVPNLQNLVKNIDVIPCCTELPIYMTYDNSDSEVFAAFTDKDRCELESKESGVPMQQTTLYFGKRK